MSLKEVATLEEVLSPPSSPARQLLAIMAPAPPGAGQEEILQLDDSIGDLSINEVANTEEGVTEEGVTEEGTT